MFTKQILSPKNPQTQSSQKSPNKIPSLFTTQALKSTSNFFSQKPLKDNESINIIEIKKNDSKPQEYLDNKLNIPSSHSHNYTIDSSNEYNLKKSATANANASHTKINELFSLQSLNDQNSKNIINDKNKQVQSEGLPKKINYDYEETNKVNLHSNSHNRKKIFEKDNNINDLYLKEDKDLYDNPLKLSLQHKSSDNLMKIKPENMVIKNQDTGEIIFLNDKEKVKKLEAGLKPEYFEKLKKRQDDVWQEFWYEKKKINQELFIGVKSNNIMHVSKLLNEGNGDKPELNVKDEKEWAVIHYATLAGNYNMVLLLIKNDAEIDSQTNLKQTPLIIAAQKGFENIVSLLQVSNCDVNHQDLNKNTALHYASIYGYSDVVKTLLANPKIIPDLRNLENKTPFEASSQTEIKRLLEISSEKIHGKLSLNLDDESNSLHKNYSQSAFKTSLDLEKSRHFSPEVRKKKIAGEKNQYDELIRPLFKLNERTLSNMTAGSDLKFQSNSTSISISEQETLLLNYDMHEKEKIGVHSFNLINMIGKGSFGEVFLVEKKSKQSEFYAMKILYKDKIIGNNLVKYAIAERNVLSFCNHPFIVKLHYAFQTNDRLFLVLDYCPGGDLSKYLQKEKRFEELKARLYATEILLALEHLHKKDIIYRDLKPDNVVLDEEGHALLTDFGLSREGVYDQIAAKSFCGSIAYLAPEMLKKTGHGKAVDWYLLGVLIYEMLVGVPPYYSSDRNEIFNNIDKSELKFPNSLSKNAISLLKMLLEKDPAKRLGSGKGQAEEIKSHKFFEGINWDDVYNRKSITYKPYLIKKNNGNKFIDMGFAFSDYRGPNEVLDNKEIDGWSFANVIDSEDFKGNKKYY